MLEAKQLQCVRGARCLFEGVSFTVARGEAVRIAGMNGAGKTSLLRLLCGLARPESGEIFFDGVSVASEVESFHAKLLYLGHGNALKDDLTPVENLRFLLATHQTFPQDVEIRAELEKLGLARTADLPVKLLSQGQKRRTALAQVAFCKTRPLWLLDEPFSALDAHAVAALAAAMGQHVGGGDGALLFTTHQDVDLPGVRIRSLSLNG
jgi:heme exporter protein A